MAAIGKNSESITCVLALLGGNLHHPQAELRQDGVHAEKLPEILHIRPQTAVSQKGLRRSRAGPVRRLAGQILKSDKHGRLRQASGRDSQSGHDFTMPTRWEGPSSCGIDATRLLRSNIPGHRAAAERGPMYLRDLAKCGPSRVGRTDMSCRYHAVGQPLDRPRCGWAEARRQRRGSAHSPATSTTSPSPQPLGTPPLCAPPRGVEGRR